MKDIFLDTEFIENGRTEPLRLISIGLVSLSGATYYAEDNSTDLALANPWVRDNVIPHLKGPRKSPEVIRDDILAWVKEECGTEPPRFRGYFADYDWVLFAQLFGRMIDLPKGWPMFCMDLKQRAEDLGIPRKAFPPLPAQAHNALADAEWNAQLFNFLESLRHKP